MPLTFDEIDKAPQGAKFYTADLHVHSYSGSDDVDDPTMTPEAIIDSAVSLGIEILALTDHNSDSNLQRAADYAQKYTGQLLFIPGVEITTADGHLLAYFPPSRLPALRTFLGKLEIKGEFGKRDTHTEMSMSTVIAEAERQGGICIAAHIDRDKTGFEARLSGYPNSKADIIKGSGLYGLEVDDPAKLTWYSDADEKTPEGAERIKLVKKRSQASSTQGRSVLAHVQNSDAHTLQGFKDQIAKRVLTKYKMADLSFDAFRTALIDPGARVRAQATIPATFPKILGMHVTGGFLDGQTIRFTDNLNCFLGGRGTGKSTAIQSLAYGLGLRDVLEEHDNCPDAVVVYCEDDSGTRFRYERLRGFAPIVKAKEDRSITEVPPDAFRVEFYGQGELAEVAKDPLKNPNLLQQFLDKHIVLGDLFERELGILERLEQNSAQLIPLESSAAQLQGKNESLKQVETKLTIAQEGKVKELAAFQVSLQAEKDLLSALSEIRKQYTDGATLAAFKNDFGKTVKESGELTRDSETAQLFADAEKYVVLMNSELEAAEQAINIKLKARAKELQAVIKEIKERHKILDQQVAARVSDLQKKGLSASVFELNTLVKQKSALTEEINRIKSQNTRLQELRTSRTKLLRELEEVRAEVVKRRKGQLRTINENLGTTIRDYAVVLLYDDGGVIDRYSEVILEVMHGTYFQDDMAEILSKHSTPSELSRWVMAGDVLSIANAIGTTKREWADELIRRFSILTNLHRLEVLWKPPAPIIKVMTKGTRPKQIPVNQLSDGQKHTILLTVAMLAESNLPLVIDQPEDDLDNAFIFSTIVTTLRDIKEKRQVILVTHNANIAVLGDSELLLPMRRASDNGQIYDRGSIDKHDTRMAVQDVLEGGELAFMKRKEIYGH